MDDPDLQVESLLGQLNHWQRLSGIDPQEDSDILSTGESNAAIEDLKRKLDLLGAHYYWDPKAWQYRLISGREPDDEQE